MIARLVNGWSFQWTAMLNMVLVSLPDRGKATMLLAGDFHRQPHYIERCRQETDRMTTGIR